MRQPLTRARLLGGSKREGRGWTLAVYPHLLGSLSGGASALSNSLQQAPVQPAAVADNPLSDALRGLDLSGSRRAIGRAR